MPIKIRGEKKKKKHCSHHIHPLQNPNRRDLLFRKSQSLSFPEWNLEGEAELALPQPRAHSETASSPKAKPEEKQ